MFTRGTVRYLLPVLLGLAVAACAPTPPANQPAGAAVPVASPPQDPGRTLVIATGRAPESLGGRPLREVRGPANPRTARRVFNAGFAINDDREQPWRSGG